MPQQITQCRQGCRIDIGGRSKPRRRTDGPVKHPSRNLHCAAGVRTAQRAAEHNLIRLADRLMNGDAMRKPRMPGVQELTEYRPMGVLECCCTMPSARIRASVGKHRWLSRQPGSVGVRNGTGRSRGLRASRPVPLRRAPKTNSITQRLWFPMDESRGARQIHKIEDDASTISHTRARLTRADVE